MEATWNHRVLLAIGRLGSRPNSGLFVPQPLFVVVYEDCLMRVTNQALCIPGSGHARRHALSGNERFTSHQVVDVSVHFTVQ